MTMTSRAMMAAQMLLAVYLVLLAYLVLLPSYGHTGLGLIDVAAQLLEGAGMPRAAAFSTAEFAGNVAMFVPLGVLLPLSIGRVGFRVLMLTVIAGGLLSTAIELAQLVIPGRVTDPRDLLANTLGALLGTLLLLALTRYRAARSARAESA